MIPLTDIEPIYFLLPVIGFVVGLFGTLLGGGGGFVFLPVLTLLIGVPAQTAVITSLVAMLPIGILGTAGHYREGNVAFKIGMLFCVAGIGGAFIGAGITGLISEAALKRSFGIYAILMAFYIIYHTRVRHYLKARRKEEFHPFHRTSIFKSGIFGFSAGILTGTFGTSGTAPVLAGLLTMNIPLKTVIGTSLLVVLSNSIFAIGAHFLVGTIDLTLVLFLTSGSTIGALLGPKLLSKVEIGSSENKFRYLFATVMIVLGFLMFLEG